MNKSKVFILSLGVVAAMTACSDSKEENPVGSWTSATPVRVTGNVYGATAAAKTLSFDFVASEGDAAGEVTYTADYDVTTKSYTDSVGDINYKVTASVKGKWAAEKGEDDDYMLTFDTNTLSVSGVDAPELGPVTDEFLTTLSQFASIEDVKVTKDRTQMSFETDHPDAKYTFVKK